MSAWLHIPSDVWGLGLFIRMKRIKKFTRPHPINGMCMWVSSSLGVTECDRFMVPYVKGQELMLVFLEDWKGSWTNCNFPVLFDSDIGLGKETKKVPNGAYSWDLAEIIGGNLFVIPCVPDFHDHSPWLGWRKNAFLKIDMIVWESKGWGHIFLLLSK